MLAINIFIDDAQGIVGAAQPLPKAMKPRKARSEVSYTNEGMRPKKNGDLRDHHFLMPYKCNTRSFISCVRP